MFSFHRRQRCMLRLCPRKKVYSLFFSFFSTYNENARKERKRKSTHYLYFPLAFCIHVCALQRNQQAEKKREKDRKEKRRATPQKLGSVYTDAWRWGMMKEIQANCIHTIIGKRKSQMSISLIVIWKKKESSFIRLLF